MAAGLSLEKKNIDAFRYALNRNTDLTQDDFIKKIWIDVPMPFTYITEKLITELDGLEPYGNDNEKPLFAQKNLKIRQAVLVGRNKNVVKLLLSDESGCTVSAVLFNEAGEFMERLRYTFGDAYIGQKMSVIYSPSINVYNGSRSIQLIIQYYRFQQI